MKRILSLFLSTVVLFSSISVVHAEATTEEIYNNVKIEFSDSKKTETLQVLILDDNVYANAEELGQRLGYQVSVSDEYVSIYNKEQSDTLPYGLTVFYYDSTDVSHMLFTSMVDSYEAPYKCIKNQQGIWIPFEYSILILNSSMMIVDNTIVIDMPTKKIVDIYMDVLKNNNTYLFDWNSDFGYSDLNWEVIGSASHVVNMFNGLLKKDGDTWGQFIQMFAMDSSAYDSKYSETIAELFCTYSEIELKQEVANMKALMGNFDSSGILGKTLSALNKSVPSDSDIGVLQQTCQELKDNIDASNGNIAAYNRAYQTLESACDKATWYSDTAGTVLDIEKSVSNATSLLDKLYTIAEVVGYAKEFQNQDEFAVSSLTYFVKESKSQGTMSKAMMEGLGSYADILQADIVTYSALRYLEKNYDDLIMQAADLSSALGTEATLELIAWDLIQSANILHIGDKIKAADKFEMTMYSSVFQSNAFEFYQRIRNDTFKDASNITSENLYSVSQSCYTYLKFCYITRNAAIASLKGKTEKTQEKIQPLIDYQNSINEEIAKYLVQLKDADESNKTLCYGFLPQDNEKYLKDISNEKLLAVATKNAIICLEDYLNNFYEFYFLIGGNESEETGDHQNWILGDGIQYGNYSESGMVDEVYIDGNNYWIYGVHIGETVVEAEEKLRLSGWKKNTDNMIENFAEFSMNDMNIWIRFQDSQQISSMGFWREYENIDNLSEPGEVAVESKDMNVQIENTYPNSMPYISRLIVTLNDGTVMEKIYDENLNNNSSGWFANVQIGDLTGDGKDEILVNLSWIGSTFGATDIYVYSIEEKKLTEILAIDNNNIALLYPDLYACAGAKIINSKLIISGEKAEGNELGNIILQWKDGLWVEE